MHQVGVAPEPEMDQGLAEFGRHRIRRDQASPRGSPGKARRLVIAEAFAQNRPQPVGRQKGDAVLLGQAGMAMRPDGDLVCIHDETFHACAKLDRNGGMLGHGGNKRRL